MKIKVAVTKYHFEIFDKETNIKDIEKYIETCWERKQKFVGFSHNPYGMSVLVSYVVIEER